MARARNIKPALFKNELLGVADPLLTILFTSLWCLADKAGRLEDRPLRIKAETFPYREGLDVNRYLTELERMGFISRYEADGERFIQVAKFLEHQNPHKTERPSTIPENPMKSRGCRVTVNDTLSDVENTEVTGLIPDSGFPRTDSLNTDSLNTAEPAKAPRKRIPQPAFEIPEWINKTHWDAWNSCTKRKKATPAQKMLAVEKLNKWREAGQDHAGALENAAMGGWAALFLPDAQKAGKQAESFREADQKAAARRVAAFTGRQPAGNVIDITPKNLEIEHDIAT